VDHFFLKTPRLGFRHWSKDDFPLAQALWRDPEVTRFIGGPWSKKKIQERLSEEIELASKHNVQYWPIFLLESREHAGCAGLRPYRTHASVLNWEFTCDTSIGVAVWQKRRPVPS
jgi:ribosomal-protein-alanine N-acetyltransferase